MGGEKIEKREKHHIAKNPPDYFCSWKKRVSDLGDGKEEETLGKV